MKCLFNAVTYDVIYSYLWNFSDTAELNSNLSYRLFSEKSFVHKINVAFDNIIYIAQQTEKGLERYISPDKQIDASTCLFPDYTWFFKGVAHGYYSLAETDHMMTVIDADRQLTVNDFDLTQFVVFDNRTRTASSMTEENCHNEYWSADYKLEHPVTVKDKFVTFFTSCYRCMEAFFQMFLPKALRTK